MGNTVNKYTGIQVDRTMGKKEFPLSCFPGYLIDLLTDTLFENYIKEWHLCY